MVDLPVGDKQSSGKSDSDGPVFLVDATSCGSVDGKLVPKTINGVECFVGLVQFVQPGHWWALLNPFVQVRDSKGNRFAVRGLLGFVIVMESARRGLPAGVVCRRLDEKEFQVVRWF